jgi:hypothetical protein
LHRYATDALRAVFGGLLTDLAGISFVPASDSDGVTHPPALLVLSQETRTVAQLALRATADGAVTLSPVWFGWRRHSGLETWRHCETLLASHTRLLFPGPRVVSPRIGLVYTRT